MTEVPKESIVAKCTQPPLMEFDGFYTIRPFDGFHLWIENCHGEGTTVTKLDFLAALNSLFERNF